MRHEDTGGRAVSARALALVLASVAVLGLRAQSRDNGLDFETQEAYDVQLPSLIVDMPA
jgi:hypothetical protein